MSPLITEHEAEFEKAIEHLKNEIGTIRGNRANPGLVEEVKVEAYGSVMTLKELASITLAEPRVLAIQPWDKSVLKEIERGLNTADLNLGIVNDGTMIRISFPALTAESRQALLKVLGQKLEQARVQIRQIRDRVKERIIAAEREKEMSEDERYGAQEDLDELTKTYTEQVAAVGARKEEELLTV